MDEPDFFFSFPVAVLIWMTSQVLQRHIPWHLDWEYPLVFIKADISEIYFSFVFFFFPRNKRKNKRYIYFLYVNLFENECIFIDRNGIFSYLLQFSPWIDCGSLCKHSLNANFACRDQRKNRCILIEKNIHSVILKWSGGKWKRRSQKKKKKNVIIGKVPFIENSPWSTC